MIALAGMNEALGTLLMVVGLLIGAISLSGLLRRDDWAHGRLFRSVCRELGIRSTDRRLLRAMARSANLPTAVSLLLSRGCFDYAVRLHLASRSAARDRIARLREMIFE